MCDYDPSTHSTMSCISHSQYNVSRAPPGSWEPVLAVVLDLILLDVQDDALNFVLRLLVDELDCVVILCEASC